MTCCRPHCFQSKYRLQQFTTCCGRCFSARVQRDELDACTLHLTFPSTSSSVSVLMLHSVCLRTTQDSYHLTYIYHKPHILHKTKCLYSVSKNDRANHHASSPDRASQSTEAVRLLPSGPGMGSGRGGRAEHSRQEAHPQLACSFQS